MTAVILLLFIITCSLLITRTAAVSLELTGMSRDAARFQARSAYCGVGFTTSESELVARHPVRRRIVMVLMLLGNAGIATVVATLIVSFTNTDTNGPTHWLWKLAALLSGLALLAFISRSTWVDRRMSQLIQVAVRRWTHLEVRDYVALLQLSKGYGVLELKVEPDDWIGGNKLSSLSLPLEGVLVLGIQRHDGTYIGAPTGKTEIRVDDMLTLYGKLDRLEELNRRRVGVAGTYARAAAVSKHQQTIQQEEMLDGVAER